MILDLPMSLILKSHGQINGTINISTTWSSMSADMDVNYYLVASPPPFYGDARITITNSSTMISIRNNTVYNATISNCPDMMYSSHFYINMKRDYFTSTSASISS